MSAKDNFFLYKYKEWARDITSLASPILLLFVPFIILGANSTYGFLLLLLLINEIIGSLIKYFFHKPRPDGQEYKGILEKIDAGSFPSLHASRITIVYLTLFSYVTDIYIQVALLFMMIAVMISRVLLKRHFITDIVGGFVIGAVLWWISGRI